jgi:hypothetical protein
LFSVSERNIGDGFALEDLRRGATAAAMVGAILLDFVCVLEIWICGGEDLTPKFEVSALPLQTYIYIMPTRIKIENP